MNKSTTTHRTIPFLWEEDESLERIAKKNGLPTANQLKEIFYDWLKRNDPLEFKRLMSIRLAHTRLVAANIGKSISAHKQAVCSVVAIGGISLITIAGWKSGNVSDFRKVSSTRVSCVRGARKEMEATV